MLGMNQSKDSVMRPLYRCWQFTPVPRTPAEVMAAHKVVCERYGIPTHGCFQCGTSDHREDECHGCRAARIQEQRQDERRGDA